MSIKPIGVTPPYDTYGLVIGLKLDAVRCSREGNDISNVGHASHKLN